MNRIPKERNMAGRLRLESDARQGYIAHGSPSLMKLLQITILLLAVSGRLSAQFGSSSHVVTVQVATITIVQVSSGSVNLNIASANAVAGQDMMTVTDQSTLLTWGTNSSNRKITIQSNLPAPLFTLKAAAISPTQGTAAPEATLTVTAVDFLTNIGRSLGNCTIRYTGVAYASQGIGTDAHTVTFTVQTQ